MKGLPKLSVVSIIAGAILIAVGLKPITSTLMHRSCCEIPVDAKVTDVYAVAGQRGIARGGFARIWYEYNIGGKHFSGESPYYGYESSNKSEIASVQILVSKEYNSISILASPYHDYIDMSGVAALGILLVISGWAHSIQSKNKQK